MQARKSALFSAQHDTDQAHWCILFNNVDAELTELFNVARVNVLEPRQQGLATSEPLVTRDHEDAVTIQVRRSTRHKCPRCRTLRKESEDDRLCRRCQAVVDAMSS